ncbi:MAG TPA: hypothetical protein VMK12_02135, partial [Anaeromyxobacteraceae bacterium]|nr:hypothetical protein [Anaeromyxobacteraceae bacterium]
MASFLIALFLLAGPEPSAPLAPEPPQTPAPVFPARRATTAAPPANNQGLGHPTLSTPAAAEDPPVPPALTATALRDELRRSKEHRQEDQAALARERSRLEKLATDIASARAALERETKNLEERVKVAGKLKKDEAPRTTSPTSKSSPPSTSARLPGPVLAKTL